MGAILEAVMSLVLSLGAIALYFYLIHLACSISSSTIVIVKIAVAIYFFGNIAIVLMLQTDDVLSMDDGLWSYILFTVFLLFLGTPSAIVITNVERIRHAWECFLRYLAYSRA